MKEKEDMEQKLFDGKAVVRSVMARKHIKTGEVADHLGIPRQTFANWVQFNKMAERLSQVADYLGCDIALVDRETGEVYK